MKKSICFSLFFLAATIVWGNAAAAQTDKKSAQFDKDLELLRKDLRAEKKQLIAANLSLTETEAQKFWVVYDQYSVELRRIYDQRVSLIQEYVSDYEDITDAKAAVFMKRAIDNEEAVTRLRQKYVPLFTKILPGKKTAMFFQIEKRLSLLIDLQLASEIPFVIQDSSEPSDKGLRTRNSITAPK